MSDTAELADRMDTATPPFRDEFGTRPALLRALGPGAALCVVVGNVIGSGIFAKPGKIAADVGDFPVIILTWVVGGILCMLGALCFAELSAMLPEAGGLYVYLRQAYGKFVAFLYGWNEFVFNRPGSSGALAVIFVSSLTQTMQWHPSPITQAALAMALIGATTWINVIGVVWGGRVNTATTVVKMGFLAFLALLPFAMLSADSSSWSAANYATTIAPPDGSTWATRFGAALLAVLWAYNGWNGVTQVAEEIREPQRNIPFALAGGVGILMFLYISVNIAYHGVLSMEEMAGAGEHAAEIMVKRLVGPIGGALMSCVIMCSTLGAINGNALIAPRVPFAMGRDGVFIRQLGWVHANYRTPAAAIAIQGIMASALVIASALLVEYVSGFENKSIFTMLTDFVVFAASIFYLLGVLAVIVLRRRAPNVERPYKTWGYPAVPLVFLASYVWFLYQVYIGEPQSANIGLLLIATGVPVYFAFQAWSRRQNAHEKPLANEEPG